MQQNIFLKQPQLKSVLNLIWTDYLCVCEVPTSFFDIAKGVIKMWGSFLWENIHIHSNTCTNTLPRVKLRPGWSPEYVDRAPHYGGRVMTEMLTARCANLTYISIHCTESSYGKNSLHWADIWQEVIATRQDTQFWLHLQLDNVYYINSLHCWGQSKWDWFWRFWTKDWLNDISKKEEKYNHVQRRRSPCSRTSGWEQCPSTSPGGSMSLLEKGK